MKTQDKVQSLTLQKTKQNIRRDSTFVCFVQHDNRVLAHQRVDQTLTLKHTVRHVLDPGLRASAVLESDGVADFLSKPAADLFRNTFRHRHGSDTPRLRAANSTPVSKTCFCKVLNHLCGLAGASVADNDQDLMLWVR
jgi:hypothetical protein